MVSDILDSETRLTGALLVLALELLVVISGSAMSLAFI
jgi:hypothetical protein